MSFPAYPSYRDSEVEWLGVLPSDWTVKPLKRLCDVRPSNVDKKTYEGDQLVHLCNYMDVYRNEVIPEQLPFMEASATYEQITRFSLRAGDVIITKDSETADDIAISAYVPADLPEVLCGYHLALLRPKAGVSGAFIKRVFDGALTKSQVAVRANGLTRVGLGQYALNNLDVPTPTLSEQTAIAAFLDRETATIDALVEEQRRLIALLKEKRQAVISHAVTKGLDPTAPMKDSGIPWLGEVPAHWEVRTVNSVSSKITNGYVGPTRDILREDGVRYLQSLHIKNGEIRFNSPYFVDEDWSNDHAKSVLNAGDLLMVQTGDLGQTAVVPDEFAGCNCHALIIVTPIRRVVSGDWLGCVFRTEYGKNVLLSIQTGALHPHLNCGNVKFVFVPVPPVPEQFAISAFVGQRSEKADALLRTAEEAITLLLERRVALISAAVTGKIDVRSLAPETFDTLPRSAEAA